MKQSLRMLVVAIGLAATAVSAQQPAPRVAPATKPVVRSAALPRAVPESVGISSERLKRLHAGMQALVDTHQVGGIVTLVAREGRVADLQTFGFQDAERKAPMQPDTVFRIMSMTKPITSVAIMMLFEDGTLALNDPVSRFIPAFRDMQVLSRPAGGGEPTLAPARRPITIRDLLTHRSGLTYGFLDNGPVGNGYRTGGVADGLGVVEGTLEQNVDRLAKVPLVSQPGAEWHYSLSTDVLGRVVEVASGMPLDRFLAERLFTPLGMRDTSFVMSPALEKRAAVVYTPDGSGGVRPMRSPESFGNTHMAPDSYRGKTYLSGGAGLVSTAQDYWRFAQMLANGGQLGGVRILGPKTVELMVTSHTRDLNLANTPVLGPGAEWGLGFKITSDVGATQLPGSPGTFGWSGILGTFFFIDPVEHLVGIAMVQRYPGAPVAGPFQALTYQALTTTNHP